MAWVSVHGYIHVNVYTMETRISPTCTYMYMYIASRSRWTIPWARFWWFQWLWTTWRSQRCQKLRSSRRTTSGCCWADCCPWHCKRKHQVLESRSWYCTSHTVDMDIPAFTVFSRVSAQWRLKLMGKKTGVGAYTDKPFVSITHIYANYRIIKTGGRLHGDGRLLERIRYVFFCLVFVCLSVCLN